MREEFAERGKREWEIECLEEGGEEERGRMSFVGRMEREKEGEGVSD